MPSSLLQKLFFICLLSSIISQAIFTHSHSQCLDHQKSLLLQLKTELIFNSSTSQKLVQWNQTEDCCNWQGVACDHAGHVITLQLDGESISGGIGNSSTLFKLEYLEKLNLAQNEFYNTDIPKGLHHLSYLTHLNLSNAHFGGQIPQELSSLRRLVSLDISSYESEIYYPIISNLETLLQNLTLLRELYLDNVDVSSQKNEWSNIVSLYLPHLRILSLCYCSLSGPLSTSLVQLRSLSVLRLDGNDLSTPVPHFLANFSGLTTLSLSSCNLKGTLPHMIFQAKTLQYIDLSDNAELGGSIPPFLENGSFMFIDLSYCYFTGLIPSTFANLTQLTYLGLSTNFIIGSLSSMLFSGLSNLASLNLGSNSLTGNIPQSLFALPSLRALSLHNNQFTRLVGEFPTVNVSKLFYLDLGFNSLTGSIPQPLFALPSLESLLLNNNQFTSQVKEFPTVNVSNLFHLDLSNNRLEGPIPSSFFQLEGLGYFELSNNMFNGTFQLKKFRSLPKIRILELSDNNLSVDSININSSSHYPHLTLLGLASCNLHKFPNFIKHSEVHFLDLSNNRIAGELPNWFWRVGKLGYANLSSNLLTGLQKPFHISPSLNVLDLSSNHLQGELYLPMPDENLTPHLGFLSFANNNLSGSIPTYLCNATLLAVLDLSHNNLSGNITPCLLQSINLMTFNIRRNNINGHIPDSFSPNCSLLCFDINHNALEGKIPKSLQSCSFLEFFNCGNNVLSDSFPCMLSSSLRVLVLHSNRFQGEVTCHKSWPNLQIIDISSNNLGGSLESINFSSWNALGSDGQLRYNRSGSNYLKSGIDYPNSVTLTIKGTQLELVKIWPDFTAIDFSSNNFHGEIPDAIGDLASLYLLNLSHNRLTGTISKSFGKLTQLGSLDLSVNRLTGSIPEEVAGLSFLSVLNLSYNKLVGVIPNGRHFQTFAADSFQGNSGLCGFPLNISCNSTEEFIGNEDLELKREIEWEYVSAAAGYVVGLGSIVWLLVFCRSFRVKYFDKIEEVVEVLSDRLK